MDIEPIRISSKCADMVYEKFIIEYSKYIPEETDLLFCNLINYIKENNLNNGQYLKVIKNTLKELVNTNIFDIEIKDKYIDFSADEITNYRLSILLPIIVKLRLLIYKKAYYLASGIIQDKNFNYELLEDINFLSKIIEENPVNNFYVDLTIYLSDDSLDRFYDECVMLSLVINALENKEITLKQIDSINKSVYKLHTKTFEYLKERFVSQNKILEKR